MTRFARTIFAPHTATDAALILLIAYGLHVGYFINPWPMVAALCVYLIGPHIEVAWKTRRHPTTATLWNRLRVTDVPADRGQLMVDLAGKYRSLFRCETDTHVTAMVLTFAATTEDSELTMGLTIPADLTDPVQVALDASIPLWRDLAVTSDRRARARLYADLYRHLRPHLGVGANVLLALQDTELAVAATTSAPVPA